MWAFGPVAQGVPGYHKGNRGSSSAMKMLDVAPPAPVLPAAKAGVSSSWMPMPADGSIDFWAERSFDSATAATTSWIGIGFSPASAQVGGWGCVCRAVGRKVCRWLSGNSIP